MKKFDTLFEMIEAFPDEQSAIDHLREIRWKDGVYCPHCGSDKIYYFSDNKNHKCGDCRKRFSIKVGSIFEDSKLPLRKWFMAIWLITSHKKGISSVQLAKDIGVTQKSAWFMLHRLRHAAQAKSFTRPLTDEVEADETYTGSKEKNKHASKRKGCMQGGTGKAAVLGILERGGELRTMETPNLRAKTVHDAIRQNVQAGTSIMTDQHGAFIGLDGYHFHHRVNHGKGEYIRHFIPHTNGIESVWALFKRKITGTHHWLSRKHLNRYLAEMTWRFNRRSMDKGERVILSWKTRMADSLTRR